MDNKTMFDKKWVLAEGFIKLNMDCEASEVLLCDSLWKFACLLEKLVDSADKKDENKILSLLKENDLINK